MEHRHTSKEACLRGRKIPARGLRARGFVGQIPSVSYRYGRNLQFRYLLRYPWTERVKAFSEIRLNVWLSEYGFLHAVAKGAFIHFKENEDALFSWFSKAGSLLALSIAGMKRKSTDSCLRCQCHSNTNALR
mmetsp:Transcript_23374/g.34503  ORF Transcript_23374/g.34503 Transcript_23374/m.34503 type:complete len:132 (+) Transcript_23374:238-633(+)